MQSTEKLWRSKEEQWKRKASKERNSKGIAKRRYEMDTRGDDTAMLGNYRHGRSVDGTGSGTAKERCDVQRR